LIKAAKSAAEETNHGKNSAARTVGSGKKEDSKAANNAKNNPVLKKLNPFESQDILEASTDLKFH
jgi:hypothetical protein